MDAVEYTRGSQVLEVEASGTTTFVAQSLKNFAGVTTPHCIAASRKHLAYNKLPGAVKLIQRISVKAADHVGDAAVLDIAALHADADAVAVVTADGQVTLLRATDMPDSTISIEVMETYKVDKAAKVVISQRVGTLHKPTDVRAGKQMFVFTSNGKVAIVPRLDTAGTAPVVAALENVSATKEVPRSIAAGNGLVAFTVGKEVRLAPCERVAGGNILNKPWTPHSEPVDFVRILARQGQNGAYVMTSAGNEVRFWTVSQSGAALHQTAELADGADSAPKGAVLKAVDIDEDFVFVADAAAGRVAVFELAFDQGEVSFGTSRITEWSVGEEIVSIAPAYRKVASTAGAPARHEMTIVARTASGVKRFALDAQRLNGPKNVADSAVGTHPQSTGATPASSSPADLAKRYGLEKATPVSASSAAPTGFTQITSTQGGQTTTKASVDPRVMQEALQEQQRAFAQILEAIDRSSVALERTATEALGSNASQSTASAAGEDSARKVASSIFQNLPTGNGSAGAVGGSSMKVNPDTFNAFTAAINECAALSVKQCLEAGLRSHTGNAVDRVMQLVQNQTEKPQLQLPKLTSLPSMGGVRDTMDKAHQSQNDLFKRQKEQDQAKYRSIVRSLQDKAKAQSANTSKYLNDLAAEIAALRKDVSSASALPTAPADATETEEQVFNGAMSLADAGQWEQALLKVTGAGKQPLTMRFLESDFIRANSEVVSTAVGSCVPLFVALAQQLTTGLAENPGAIPARADWLHSCTLAFDEFAEDAAEQRVKDQLAASRVHIANIADAVAEAEGERSSIDRGARRHLKVVTRALKAYGV